MAIDQDKGSKDRIKVEEEESKDQQITIRQQSSTQKKAGSIWSWHEEFAVQWSETFIAAKPKKGPKK